jgi:hypothetical protein
VNCFATFSTDSKSASKSALIDTHMAFLKEKNVWVTFHHFLQTLKANGDKAAEKTETFL